MSKDFSFDVVSDFEHQELVNAIDQARREVQTRYDFKGSKAGIEPEGKEALTLKAEDDYKMGALIDILQSKMIKRGLSLKILDLSKPQEDAKAISKKIREAFPKVKAAIQGEELRVFSSKKDELQGVINLLTENDFDFPLQFINYR